MKAFLVAGVSSNSGKTTMTLGLTMALKRRGLIIQPYKVGPDYIDTSWHTAVAGVPSRNLDAFMLTKTHLAETFYRNLKSADIGIVEGVMGLYDGIGVDHLHGSSAGAAIDLNIPTVLIVDGSATSTSIAATVQGFVNFEKRLKFAGVIFNKVGSDYHFELLKSAVETYCPGVTVLGRVPKITDTVLPSRHLGLYTAQEHADSIQSWDNLVDAIEQHVDLDLLIENVTLSGNVECSSIELALQGEGNGLKIAIAKDEAFNFYYQDNLDLLASSGAELVEFSPLSDSQLPECDAVYIGGGYPEEYGAELAKNESMKRSILQAHLDKKPIYAECGGLMYLGNDLYDRENRCHQMVGIIDGSSVMSKRLQRFGYCEATSQVDTTLCDKGFTLRGHEFHYSEFNTTITPAFEISKTKISGERQVWGGGYQVDNTLATYLHTHFGQAKELVSHWLKLAREQ